MIFIAIIFVKSTKKPTWKTWLSNNKLCWESALKDRQLISRTKYKIKRSILHCTNHDNSYSTSPYNFRPNPYISPQKWCLKVCAIISSLFLKYEKYMQMIWKINKKFETRQRKNKKTNKKQQQKRQEKKNTPSYSQRQGQHYDI